MIWNDIHELDYNDEISNLSLNNEKINNLLPKKLAICVTFFYREEKINILKKVCKEFDVKTSNIVYIGDDVNDMDLLKNVGISISPADAWKNTKLIVEVNLIVTILNHLEKLFLEFLHSL